MRSTRSLQLGLLALLLACIAQVLYWIVDQTSYTRSASERTIDLFEADLRAAQALVQAGTEIAKVRELFPHLVTAGEGPQPDSLMVDPQVLQSLQEERRGRINRYGWEGTFFLCVLIVGVGVLGQALRRAAALRQRQEDFLAAVSHEFKSPTASLRLSVETLALREPDGERKRVLVGRMLDDLDRLETLIHNVLDAARIEEGEFDYSPQLVDLGALAAELLAPFAHRAAALDVQVETQLQDRLIAHVDPAAARMVLHNLLDNALKSCAAADSRAMCVRGARRDGLVELTVVDDGLGFEQADARRLFQKFYRAGDELRRRQRGAGLGLFLVSRLVALGKGQVSASSDGPGHGATFSVSWPEAREELNA